MNWGWDSIAIIAFCAIFFVTGILRVVEFRGIGLTPFVRRFLIAVHILGCASFAGALAMFALDPQQRQKQLTYALFAGGVFTLFPVHIYVALKRRVTHGKLTKD